MIYLTPELCEQLYETLRLTRPFRAWKLPPADDVIFHVNHSTDAGEYIWNDVGHNIHMSAKRHHQLNTALMTMAHEMIHLREKVLGIRQDVGHGAPFHAMAKQVCKHHGFDRGIF